MFSTVNLNKLVELKKKNSFKSFKFMNLKVDAYQNIIRTTIF